MVRTTKVANKPLGECVTDILASHADTRRDRHASAKSVSVTWEATDILTTFVFSDQKRSDMSRHGISNKHPITHDTLAAPCKWVVTLN